MKSVVNNGERGQERTMGVWRLLAFDIQWKLVLTAERGSVGKLAPRKFIYIFV